MEAHCAINLSQGQRRCDHQRLAENNIIYFRICVWQWRTAGHDWHCPVKSLIYILGQLARLPLGNDGENLTGKPLVSTRVHCPLVWTNFYSIAKDLRR